jgi:hypothetical protein
VKLGTENRTKTMIAGALGALAILALVYQVFPMFSGSSAPAAASQPVTTTAAPSRPGPRRGGPAARKVATQPDLDPTLKLDKLAPSEQTKYEGSGRNIFVSQAEVEIPKVIGRVSPDQPQDKLYTPPPIPPAAPIPLKFFGFASQPGERKRIFLSKGDDVFIAGEGEIVDRRYKVIRISSTSVEVQDLVGSGQPQIIPLTQG